MDKAFIANRIREERERCGLRQEDVAKYMNWNASKHSIVGEVEAGNREVKAWELYKLAQLFQIRTEDFFKESIQESPLVLWRKKPKENAVLKERKFLQRCEDYGFLEEVLGKKLLVPRALPRYTLDIHSSDKKWANDIADNLRKELSLGDFPVNILAKTLEEHYGVRFLVLSLGKEDKYGSAACTVDNFGPAILLNSDECITRQIFSIAHELFHMITWDKNFFKTILSDQKLNKKNEYLANVFAAGLLLPEEGLRQQIRHLNEDDSIQYSTIMAIAREYGVSIQTLLYRLEFLGLVNQEFVDNSLADPLFQSSIREKGRKSYSNQTQIGDRFIRIAYLAYQFGKISRSRFARLVDTSLVSLESFLASHGLMEIDNEKTRLGNS